MGNRCDMPLRGANSKAKARKSAGLGRVRAMLHAKAHIVLAKPKNGEQENRKRTGKISPEQI
jgi:hypothetical protein